MQHMKHQSLAEAGHASKSEVAGLPVCASKSGVNRFTGLAQPELCPMRLDNGDGGHVASSRSLCQAESKVVNSVVR